MNSQKPHTFTTTLNIYDQINYLNAHYKTKVLLFNFISPARTPPPFRPHINRPVVICTTQHTNKFVDAFVTINVATTANSYICIAQHIYRFKLKHMICTRISSLMSFNACVSSRAFAVMRERRLKYIYIYIYVFVVYVYVCEK